MIRFLLRGQQDLDSVYFTAGIKARFKIRRFSLRTAHLTIHGCLPVYDMYMHVCRGVYVIALY